MPQTIDVPGMGQVEFPDGMSDQDITSAIQKNLGAPTQAAPASYTDPSYIAKSLMAPMTGSVSRLMGVADTGMALSQLGAHSVGIGEPFEAGRKKINEHFEQFRQKMEPTGQAPGYDVDRLAGSMAGPSAAASKIGALAPAVQTAKRLAGVAGRAGLGAVQGGVGAAMQPVENTDEGFWTPKGMQAAIGAIAGGTVPLVTDTVKGIGNLVSPITDLFKGERGIENLARRGYEKNIGKDRLQEIKDALVQAREIVPGDKPTAAEAVAHLPSGSPVQALQKITATTEGGPSAQFGERLAKQNVAREIAERTRNTLTAPLREEALTLANQGGVKSADVLDGITGIQKQPDLGASDVVSKSLDHLTEKIHSLTDKNGIIDAKALYTVRKELGNTIGKFSQETQNWDKRLTGRIQGYIQKGMDHAMNQAIERAQPSVPLSAGAAPGRTVWDRYLTEYSNRSHDIAESLARKKLSLKPWQSTTLSSSKDIAMGNMPHLALLSRPVVMANALMSHIGKTNIEPKIDALNTKMLLDPNKLGQFLDDVPPRYRPMIEALMQQAPAAAGTATGRNF